MKGFGEILPQICMSILWYGHAVGGREQILPNSTGGCKTFLYSQGGTINIFNITEHFTPLSPYPALYLDI